MTATLCEVSVDDIESGVNVRHKLLDEKLREMAVSIKAQGVLVPLWLEPGERRRYRIVDGAHRYAGAKLAGLTTVPAYVQTEPLSATQRVERQLVVNCQRSDLTPIEKAEAIAGLMKATEQTASEVAARIGSTSATVSRLLSLLKLPAELQAMVGAGRLSASSAYAISLETDPERQRSLATEAVEGRATRDQLAQRTRRRNEPKAESAKQTPTRLTLNLPEAHRLTYSGVAGSLDSFAELLASLAAKARKSARGGCDLSSFVALLNAETRAKA